MGAGFITSLNIGYSNDSRILKKNKDMFFTLILAGLMLIFSSSIGSVSAVTVNDTHPPIISSTNPANNAVSVSTSKVVKITFNEAVKKGSMWIEFKTTNGKPVQYTSTLTSKTLYIKPKSQLEHNTVYSIILHSGSVKDMAGNGLSMYSTKFTTAKQKIKNYSASGVSFNYPANWYVNTDNHDGIKFVFGTKNFSQLSPQFQLEIVANPKDISDQMAIDGMYSANFPTGFKVISKHIYTLNGNRVYGLVYTINNKKYYPVIMETKEINIVKNHKIYTMDFTAPQKTFAYEKNDFNIIAQSLKIL